MPSSSVATVVVRIARIAVMPSGTITVAVVSVSAGAIGVSLVITAVIIAVARCVDVPGSIAVSVVSVCHFHVLLINGPVGFSCRTCVRCSYC